MKKLLPIRSILLVAIVGIVLLLSACSALPQIEKAVKPQRIVSMSITIDHFLLGLVEAERIQALSELVDDEDISYVTEEAKKVPKRIVSYGAEEIMSMKPDLVIADSSWRPDALETLKQAGIRVEVVNVAKTLEEVPASLMQVAILVGEESKGKALVEKYQRDLQQSLEISKDYSKKSVYTFWGRVSYGGYDSFLADLYRHGNAVNCLENMEQVNVVGLNPEYVMKMDPDIIVLSTYGSGKSDQAEIDSIERLDGLQSLRAIREHHVLRVKGRVLYSPNQYAPQSLKTLVETIHQSR